MLIRLRAMISPTRSNIQPGTTATGTVIKVADYGALVRLDCGKVGLVHISEIANTFVRDVSDYVKESDRVTVKILRENDRGRFEFSIKQCDLPSTPPPVKQPPRAEPVFAGAAPVPKRPDDSRSFGPAPQTFEDRLSMFLKDSEERQLDLKRHMDIRRGRR